MFYLHILILILYLRGSEGNQVFDHRLNYDRLSDHVPERTLKILKAYYEETHLRISNLNEIRFTYEETAQYEMGYIMGEVIERYSKMVTHPRRAKLYKADSIFANVKRLALVQKLYFEIYHLVRMVHEIPLKYGLKEDASKEPLTKEEEAKLFDIQAHMESVAQMEKERARMEKKRKKQFAKMREALLIGGVGNISDYLNRSSVAYAKAKFKNKWPRDYGWDIEDWD